jgi:regulator of PEP synthase PpsR (kinase-PPPase family)
MPQTIKRTAFIVSDRTGLTAEAMAHSLLSQFPNIDFQIETFTFVDNKEKAVKLVDRCKTIKDRYGIAPMVFLTLVDDEMRELFTQAEIAVFDLFHTFIGPMEERLGVKSSHTIGQSHGVQDEKAYTSRIAAMHFAMQTDDGMDVEHYRKADLIMVGVSRCGKTPASLYMSLHYGLYVSNYPLTERELEFKRLPDVLHSHKSKLFGLTIDPFRLLKIRQKRYGGSSYSDSATCQREIAQAESIFRAESIPYINTTSMSVEEIGAMVVNLTKPQQRP